MLEAVGAEKKQLVTGPAQEGAVAVLGSLVVGLPLGLLLGIVAVRVLGLFFTLPPPVVSVPAVSLVGFVLLMVIASAVALAVALLAVTRIAASEALREP